MKISIPWNMMINQYKEKITLNKYKLLYQFVLPWAQSEQWYWINYKGNHTWSTSGTHRKQFGDWRQASWWIHPDNDLKTQFDKASAPWAIRQCRVSGHKNMVIALFPSIWAGAENIKMCRPPMCGGLTWALCIFYRQRLGLGEFCLIADCHRKLTWGSRHEFHIIFLASSNSGASRKKNSSSTKVGRFPTIWE